MEAPKQTQTNEGQGQFGGIVVEAPTRLKALPESGRDLDELAELVLSELHDLQQKAGDI